MEREFAFEFDQPSFLTLGAAYEQRPRLSGGAYHSLLRRILKFTSGTRCPSRFCSFCSLMVLCPESEGDSSGGRGHRRFNYASDRLSQYPS